MINRDRCRLTSIATTLLATLALAGCSDAQDISYGPKKGAAGSSETAARSTSNGSGGTNASVPSDNTAGSPSLGGTAGAGETSGAGGTADLSDAGSNTLDAGAPAPAKLGAVLFSADFEDGKMDPWTTYDGSLAIAEGGAGASTKALGFRTTAKNSIGKAVTAGAPSATSFALESDIMFEAGGQASLIFRVSSPTTGGPDNLTGYGVGLDTGASSLWAAKFANMWSPLGMDTASLLPLTWYHLRIDVHPGHFTVFLDGTFMMEISDASLVDPGMIGIRGDWGPMGDSGTAPEVLFDNVKQTAIVESDAGP